MILYTSLSLPPFPPHYADVSSPPLFSSHYAVTCTGRIVRSYFEGHGNFLGMVVSKIPERPVVWVVYTDGGGEELYLYVPKKPSPPSFFVFFPPTVKVARGSRVSTIRQLLLFFLFF